MLVRLITKLDDGHCTSGRISIPGGPSFFTLERPWLNNKPGISCIPRGHTYHAKLRQSPHLGLTYWLYDVPDRQFILIHSGNIVSQVLGCIMLGLNCGTMRGERAVFQSVVAVRQFMKFMGGEPFTLEVV